jgi:hypothetical protein
MRTGPPGPSPGAIGDDPTLDSEARLEARVAPVPASATRSMLSFLNVGELSVKGARADVGSAIPEKDAALFGRRMETELSVESGKSDGSCFVSGFDSSKTGATRQKNTKKKPDLHTGSIADFDSLNWILLIF